MPEKPVKSVVARPFGRPGINAGHATLAFNSTASISGWSMCSKHSAVARSENETAPMSCEKRIELGAARRGLRPRMIGKIGTTKLATAAEGYGQSPVVTIVSVVWLVSVVLILPIVGPKRLAPIPCIEETSVRGKRIRCATTGGFKTANSW